MSADIIEYEEIEGTKYPVIACIGRRDRSEERRVGKECRR